MTYQDALATLSSLNHMGIRLGLGPVRSLLRWLGNPQDCYPAVLSAASPFQRAIEIREDPSGALRSAFLRAVEEDLICVAGSLYLVGKIKDILRRQPSAAIPEAGAQ
jgi:folylpolyglutamate synthase/dihydropteroate synthase